MAKGSKPVFNVRAKTGRKDKDENDIFATVGAAWAWQKGTGYNLKVDSLPVGWDGYLMLTEPREDDER